jgi:rhamnopyranosyl-N-acetylglucosaminyl-diphospho-decaprenol beta-1,3/1,4-galactofuranosyltransferase
MDSARRLSALTPGRDRVVAVVVTYNRYQLLRRCLQALQDQERRPDTVIVVDNASTDGTAEMVRAEAPWARLLSLERNLGGAGGFHAGLRAAHEAGAEWSWLLDDDTLPRPDALLQLLKRASGTPGLAAPSVLASRVVWRDGREHPMNMPIVARRDIAHLVACAEVGVLPLRAATFVSFLVARGAVERHGLPLADYFIWADDIEYSARILRRERGYVVPDSVVEHSTPQPHTSVTHGGKRFYYHARNTLFMLRGDAWERAEKQPILWTLVASSLAFLRVNRFSADSVLTLARGLRDGLGTVPRNP